MTPESQLIALLEFLGWKNIKRSYLDALGRKWFGDHPEHGRCECPPLTLDLMHEAITHLRRTGDQFQWLEFDRVLFEVVWGRSAHGDDSIVGGLAWDVINATKEQRLEALLRTLNKWVESEVAK